MATKKSLEKSKVEVPKEQSSPTPEDSEKLALMIEAAGDSAFQSMASFAACSLLAQQAYAKKAKQNGTPDDIANAWSKL